MICTTVVPGYTKGASRGGQPLNISKSFIYRGGQSKVVLRSLRSPRACYWIASRIESRSNSQRLCASQTNAKISEANERAHQLSVKRMIPVSREIWRINDADGQLLGARQECLDIIPNEPDRREERATAMMKITDYHMTPWGERAPRRSRLRWSELCCSGQSL